MKEFNKVSDFAIDAETRTIVGKKVGQLRARGLVPVAVYGPKVKPLKLQIPYRPLEVTLMKAGGTNLIDLNVNGETHVVLAREVQRDVLRGSILHVDFFVVDQSSKIRMEVPIHLINESPVVAARKGILLTGTNTVTVETLPRHLIHVVEVDLSKLVEIGDSITIADLDLGPDVTIINEPEEMLARVAQTSADRAEEDLAEGEEVVSAEPEVIARGKALEEEED